MKSENYRESQKSNNKCLTFAFANVEISIFSSKTSVGVT